MSTSRRPSPRAHQRLLAVWLAASLLATGGCAGRLSLQAMAQQPRAEPYDASVFFDNLSSARPIPDGTVPRGTLPDDSLLFTGRVEGEFMDAFPFVVTLAVLERGQERYNIYCAPCHGAAGTGTGIIVQRGFTPPPSFHIQRLREAPAGYFYAVITEGIGVMAPYNDQVVPADRWAIVAYIRALQLSQNAALDDVPVDRRDTLPEGPAP